MASEGYHEPLEQLSEEVIDRHRVIVSIMEEFEAADWYDQRVSATKDPTLAAVLAHNRDEEKEHAAMAIEWLRRHDPVFDRHLRTYLFTTGAITEIEESAEPSGAEPTSGPEDDQDPGGPEGRAGDGGTSVGSLRSEQTGKESR